MSATSPSKRHRSSVMERLAFSPLARPCVNAFCNRFGQNLLGSVQHIVQHLMGIGSGSSVHFSGEATLPDLCKRRGPPPYTIMDVGANLGDFVDVCLRRLGADVRVHGFDPALACFTELRRRFDSDHRVRLNHMAVGSESGEATLHSNVVGSGSASLTKPDPRIHGAEFNLTETVRVITLDAYAEQHSIDRISLLKVDVEGHELDVLQGGRRLFDQRRVDIVSFEFCAAAIETRVYFRDFFLFFESAGMRLHRLTRSGYLHPLTHYSEFHEQFRTTNFVALRIV